MKTIWAIGADGREACEQDWLNGEQFWSLVHNSYFSIKDSKTLWLQGNRYIRFMSTRPRMIDVFDVDLYD